MIDYHIIKSVQYNIYIKMRNPKNGYFSSNLKFLFKMTKASVVGMLMFTLTLLIFYVIGNYQEFLDSSLKLILKVISYSVIMSIFLSVFSFFDLIITVIFSDISFFQLFWEFFFVGVIIVDILILSFTGIVSNLSFGI